jgi:hypothetical protein
MDTPGRVPRYRTRIRASFRRVIFCGRVYMEGRPFREISAAVTVLYSPKNPEAALRRESTCGMGQFPVTVLFFRVTILRMGIGRGNPGQEWGRMRDSPFWGYWYCEYPHPLPGVGSTPCRVVPGRGSFRATLLCRTSPLAK